MAGPVENNISALSKFPLCANKRDITLTQEDNCNSVCAVLTGHSLCICGNRRNTSVLTFWRRNYFFLNFSTPCI